MCLLLNCKIVHCELHVFSFSFVHAPVCANCKNDSCNIYSKKKKKKKKKKERKTTRTSVWVKNTKVMPQDPTIYLSLGKGRESLHLQTLHKKLSKSALSALPPARNHSDSDTVWTSHAKINQN